VASNTCIDNDDEEEQIGWMEVNEPRICWKTMRWKLLEEKNWIPCLSGITP
jgi:hypothetical protein